MIIMASLVHCTYIIQKGGKSVAIDLEVAVKRALQQIHMFKPQPEKERERC